MFQVGSFIQGAIHVTWLTATVNWKHDGEYAEQTVKVLFHITF